MTPEQLQELMRLTVPQQVAATPQSQLQAQAPLISPMPMAAAAPVAPIIQPQQTPIQQMAPVQAPVPQVQLPPPVKFETPPISPLMQERNLYARTEPTRADPKFQQGKLHTILNAIASGMAGAAAGPKAGIETAQTLRDLKFNRTHADWAQTSADYDKQIKEEQARMGVGEKVLGAGVQQYKTAARIGEANAKLTQGGQKLDEKTQADTNLDRYHTALARVADAKLKKKTPAEIEYQLYKDDPDLYEEYRQARAGRESPEDTLKKIISQTTARDSIHLKFAESIAAAGERGRQSEKPKEEIDEPTIQKFADLAKTDPMSVSDNLKNYPLKVRKQILSDPRIELPKSYTPQEKLSFDNAKTTLGHVTNLRKMIDDPYVKSHMEPIVGRIQNAEGIIGGKPIGATPEESRKEGEFLNYITYVLAWESKQLSGARPAWKIIEMIKKTGAKANMDPSRFQGALDAVENSVDTNMRSIMSRSPSTSGQKAPKWTVKKVEDVK